jgi:hypothetical protein
MADQSASRPEDAAATTMATKGSNGFQCVNSTTTSPPNAKAGPIVGQDVFAVGFEDEGIDPATRMDEIVTEVRIEDSSYPD